MTDDEITDAIDELEYANDRDLLREYWDDYSLAEKDHLRQVIHGYDGQLADAIDRVEEGR